MPPMAWRHSAACGGVGGQRQKWEFNGTARGAEPSYRYGRWQEAAVALITLPSPRSSSPPISKPPDSVRKHADGSVPVMLLVVTSGQVGCHWSARATTAFANRLNGVDRPSSRCLARRPRLFLPHVRRPSMQDARPDGGRRRRALPSRSGRKATRNHANRDASVYAPLAYVAHRT